MRKMGGVSVDAAVSPQAAAGAVPPVQPTEFELLCALIAGSTGPRPADLVGRELLGRFGSVSSILREPPSSLTSVRGVGRGLATRLRATGEIARRFLGAEKGRPVVYLSGPEDVADLLLREMSSLDREHFRAILLNTKNRILGVRTIAIGSLNASVVHAREVFKAAVSESAQAVVLVHNHPSGIPDPSEEDIVVTERLAEAGRILGIEVLDHIILGRQGFVSLRELGHV
ncbi:MAG: DNA repair protein RadC [Candidatus Eisenbacteria bacterium]|nr:DNA repair protein RadC [Candidatus Eisenbacteria bacterium]